MASSQLPLVQSQHSDSELDQSLNKLENLLAFLGFCQYTFPRAVLSWLVFFILAIAVPLLSVEYSRCYDCDKFEIEAFDLEIIVSRAVVAAVSLLCVSRNLRKYGVRKALFVNRCHGNLAQFRKQYIQKIRVFYCLLGSWFGVCSVLKITRELTRIIYLNRDPWWSSSMLFVASISSWSYTTLVFLAGCALFNLVGNLQVIHFENFGKFLESDLDVSFYIEEHMSLTHDLSKISHRFRMFLLLQFLTVTASQFMTLLRTTENQSIINLINGGDFGVLSIVQLVGIVVCITAAAKISHRAQGLGSVASRWHAVVTSNSNDGSGRGANGGNSDSPHPVGSLTVNYSECDLESADYIPFPANGNLTSSTTYQKRQAFVTYVQSNAGGFTIFGWLVDRLLINTIFFTELSLAFFVLGKTITFTVK